MRISQKTDNPVGIGIFVSGKIAFFQLRHFQLSQFIIQDIFDFEDNCWEIIPDPVPKKVKLRDLTKKQYMKRYKKNCQQFGKYCDGCPFQKVVCNLDKINSIWYLNKDLYSDEFLDQEIEIDSDD